MRKGLGAVAVIGWLGFASPLWAQSTGFFGGVNPTQLTFTPVDTTQNLAAPVLLPTPSPVTPSTGLASYFPTQSLTSFFSGRSLASIFPSWMLPSFLAPAQIPTSPLPPPSSYPGVYYKSPIQPMMPILSNQQQ